MCVDDDDAGGGGGWWPSLFHDKPSGPLIEGVLLSKPTQSCTTLSMPM